MISVYFDWNVFNKIEKIDELDSTERIIYTDILSLLKARKIITVYSNAHIHDLIRGFIKNPDYIETHLQTLSELTLNLCLTQYWGESKVRWHIREPKEYFESALDDASRMSVSFSQLFDSFQNDPLINATFEIQKSLLRILTVDDNFKKIYSVDPIFSLMFPITKVEMNQLALCEDLFNFSNKIKSDFALYKNFRKYLDQLRLKLPQYQKLYAKLNSQIIGLVPKYLTWDQMWEQTALKFEKSSNASYDKLFTLYTTTDLKGYRPDEKFANLIDDALHSFYGGHCTYFVTRDGRCIDKAKKVYEKLKIPTIVAKPEEFRSMIVLGNT